MNTLLGIVRNIALLALIGSFWELLIPSGRLRGPVRLVIGLLVVSCVVLPLTDMLAHAPASWELPKTAQSGPETALAEGQAIAAALGEQAHSQYEREMSRQMAALILLTEGVEASRASVSADAVSGALLKAEIELELKPEAEAESIQSKVKNLVNTFFALEEENIDCRLKGGEEHL